MSMVLGLFGVSRLELPLKRVGTRDICVGVE